MGWGAARKLRASVANLEPGTGGGADSAAQGLDLRSPLAPAPGTGAALGAVRERIAGPGPDRFLAPDLAPPSSWWDREACVTSVESRIGALQ